LEALEKVRAEVEAKIREQTHRKSPKNEELAKKIWENAKCKVELETKKVKEEKKTKVDEEEKQLAMK